MIINIDRIHKKNDDSSINGLQNIVGGEVRYLPLIYSPSAGGLNALVMLENSKGFSFGLKTNLIASMLVGTHIVGNVVIVAPQETRQEGFGWRVLNKDEYNDIEQAITRILKKSNTKERQ